MYFCIPHWNRNDSENPDIIYGNRVTAKYGSSAVPCPLDNGRWYNRTPLRYYMGDVVFLHGCPSVSYLGIPVQKQTKPVCT